MTIVVVRLDDVTTEAAMWQLLHANKADQSSHCRNYAQQRYDMQRHEHIAHVNQCGSFLLWYEPGGIGP